MEQNITTNEEFTNVIDLSATRRKKFGIKLDDDSELGTLYLNTSDTGIISRLNEVYPKLSELAEEALKNLNVTAEDSLEDVLEGASEMIRTIDEQMREQIDYLFDSNVSDICAPNGLMIDPFDGKFRFEHIIYSLASLYDGSFKSEYTKMSARMRQHVSKYKNKKKK